MERESGEEGRNRGEVALLQAQVEVLRLWRCCLAYGVDIEGISLVLALAPGTSSGLTTHRATNDAGAALRNTIPILGRYQTNFK